MDNLPCRATRGFSPALQGIAHEIRNPLTVIGGFANRLFNRETDPGKMAYLAIILKECCRIEQVIKN